jgi:hypothetical protein
MHSKPSSLMRPKPWPPKLPPTTDRHTYNSEEYVSDSYTTSLYFIKGSSNWYPFANNSNEILWSGSLIIGNSPRLPRRRRGTAIAGPHRGCFIIVDFSFLSRGVLPVFYLDSISDTEALPNLHWHILCSPCAWFDVQCSDAKLVRVDTIRGVACVTLDRGSLRRIIPTNKISYGNPLVTYRQTLPLVRSTGYVILCLLLASLILV